MSTPRSLPTSRRRTAAAVVGIAAAGALGGVLSAAPAGALAAAPSAGLVGAVCDQGGSLLHLENRAAEATSFTVTVDGRVAGVVALPAGAMHDEIVPVPDGTEATVSVSAPGMATLTATVVQDCAAGGTVEAAPLRLVASYTGPAAVVDLPARGSHGANPFAIALLHLGLALVVRAVGVRRRAAS